MIGKHVANVCVIAGSRAHNPATTVRGDGFPQYVQQPGAAPAKVTAGSTANYGVGAFLLAGSQLARLCGT